MPAQTPTLARHLLENLHALAAAYGEHVGRAPSTVSYLATGSGDVLPRWKAGRSCPTVQRLDETLIWFSANWPEDLEWPDDVPRPRPLREAAR